MKIKKLFSVICLSAGLMLAMPMAAGAADANASVPTEQTTEAQTAGQADGTDTQTTITEEAAPEVPLTEEPATEVPITEVPVSEAPESEIPVPETEQPEKQSAETSANSDYSALPQAKSKTAPRYVNTFIRDEEGNIHFYDENGNIYKDGLLEFEGKIYYLNPEEGYRLVGGPVEISGDLWLFGYDGALITGLSGANHIKDIGDFYLNPDGHLDTGWKRINNEWRYYSPEYGSMVIGLIHADGKMYYTDLNGRLCTGDFKGNDGSTWYYANKSGELVTGWRKSNGKWYYYSPLDGKMASNNWLTVNNKNYFVTGSGAMLTGWQKIDGLWYYMEGSGSRKTGWVKTSNKWYYLQPGTGVMVTNDWRNIGGKYYYLTNSGAMKTGWLQIGNEWYYLDSSGSMATQWRKVGSKWYYMNDDGTMKANCWLKDAGKWYYIRSSGAMATGWLKIDGDWYLFNNSGAMRTGWQLTGGRWYYMDGGGKMQTGWQNVKNIWYYLNSSGSMQTGWLKLEGHWYYLDGYGKMQIGWLNYHGNKYYLDTNTGRMFTGKHTISGTEYDFKSSGGIPINLNEIPGKFRIVVDRANNYINVYKGKEPYISMLCSTGMGWATPTGKFTIQDKLRWHELDGPTFGQYCSHITADILFHSVPMPTPDPNALVASEFNKLGQFASHGCIRLSVGDAKWLFDNCPVNTIVEIGDNLKMDLPKPRPTQIPSNQTWDPTDPYFF